MTAPRLFAVLLILAAASFGWVILGASVQERTQDAGSDGFDTVGSLWGQPQVQSAPTFSVGKKQLAIRSSDITADFALDQRRKGLLWYSTYRVDFSGMYGVRNESDSPERVVMSLAFPAFDGVYDGFHVSVDGDTVPVEYRDGVALAGFNIPAGKLVSVQTGYRTQGLDEWRYQPNEGVGVVDDFTLAMRTDFSDIDFPANGVSPISKERSGDGRDLTWSYESLVSGRPIGLVMPKPLNPGPVASRISFFAPVSLLFYFASLVLVTAIRGVNLHPINYGFLAAGFFAFHLLFAYLVDRVDIGWSFAIASLVSVGLCVAYLRLAIADTPTLIEAAAGQTLFLVLFSFSFFFEGYTGLAITIGAVLTLAFFMFRTGRTNWGELFERSRQERAAKRLHDAIPVPGDTVACTGGVPPTGP
ncbi:MAG: inner membrane CreD family protein [Coriobacteriia bacterium]